MEDFNDFPHRLELDRRAIVAESIEQAHFESGLGEVVAPNPDETFALPHKGSSQWVKAIIARRQNLQQDKNHCD